MDLKVGILAIGNEVIEGQIVNKNAAWLSEELEGLGAHVLYHLSCRDDKNEINNSLSFLEKSCQLILVSGGLGPTRDDCTRQNIAEWSESPLVLNQEEWLFIQEKLNKRGVTLREGHKNQAFIPSGAQVLKNHVGIAPGFFLKHKAVFLASLPGPPNELKNMFTTDLKPIIVNELKPQSDLKLYKWICFGAPESEVAHIVESLVGERFQLGFRLHKPCVEVKIWAEKEILPSTKNLFSLIEDKLKPWVVGQSINQIRENFLNYLNDFKKVYVVDHISEGLFLEKLSEFRSPDNVRYQSFEKDVLRHFSLADAEAIVQRMSVNQGEGLICLLPQSDSSFWLATENKIVPIEIPRNIKITSDLGKHYALESCFLNLKKV